MYTREIMAPRASPIENGSPIFGTWNKAFETVNLREISRPFPYPLPKWVCDSRIKEWVSFSAHNEDILLEAMFCNLKYYRIAQILIFNKKTGESSFYKKFKPGSGWDFPKSLSNSSIDSRSKGFYFRIHNWLDADTIRLDINIEASRRNPSLTVHLAYNVSSKNVIPMSVSLNMAEQRNLYAFKALTPVRGDIVIGKDHTTLNQNTCSGFFCDYKGYFPYKMQSIFCSAMGFDEENHMFGFHIAENQTRETNKNNENALWVNGHLTPLPPVRITMPKGPDADWVIQDVEGMVDLTFTPKEQNKSGLNLLFTQADYSAPLGHYNGMLVNSKGKQIQIKNLFGTGETLYLRV